MAYKVLYRKYRPDNFKSIIGQKNIVTILQNSVIEENFSHAYIFTGPRGTGKTSTAKILAKTINCENRIEGEACGKCQSCLNINVTPDIIEIDAASNNGVDEIRELRNNVTLAPSSSKYKIYIIDEVHMLTTGAFNALLKTLEEPPSHAIFILATTEIYKVPITILSRCQRYDFKKIEKKEMIDHLKYICEKEKFKYEEKALEEIYQLSEGCVRDALSILDQISKITKVINSETLCLNYEIVTKKDLNILLNSIKTNNCETIVETLNSIEKSGLNAQKLIKNFITYLEDIAIEIKMKKTKEYSFELIKNIIKDLNGLYMESRINDNTYTMIKLCFMEYLKEPNKEIKFEKIELKKEKTEYSLNDIRINNCFCKANKDDLNKIKTEWKSATEKNIKFKNIQSFSPVAASDEYIILAAEDESLVNLLNIKYEEIEKNLHKININQKIVALSNKQWINEKQKYILNIKNQTKYSIIEEPIKEDGSNEIKQQVDTIFNDKTIEIS